MSDDQRVLMEYESYRGQMEVFKKNLTLIDASLAELEVTKSVLDSIGEVEEKNEVLFPIGSGAFVSGRLLETEKVILDIGANVAAKKSLEEAKEDIGEKRKSLESVRGENLSSLQAVARKLEELAPQVEGIMAKMQE